MSRPRRKQRPALEFQGQAYCASWPRGIEKGRVILTISLDTKKYSDTNSFDVDVPEEAYQHFKSGRRVKVLVVAEEDY